MLEVIILSILAIWFVLAVIHMVRTKKRGGCISCSADCTGCNRRFVGKIPKE